MTSVKEYIKRLENAVRDIESGIEEIQQEKKRFTKEFWG